jgi:hypothetical protein
MSQFHESFPSTGDAAQSFPLDPADGTGHRNGARTRQASSRALAALLATANRH